MCIYIYIQYGCVYIYNHCDYYHYYFYDDDDYYYDYVVAASQKFVEIVSVMFKTYKIVLQFAWYW